MNGVTLQFFLQENRKHHGILLYEWLLEQAKRLGIHGGSAFRAMAGFGRHGLLHEDHFFELAGDLPVMVVFVVTPEEADQLLDRLKKDQLSVFYTRMPVQYGLAYPSA